MELPVSGKWIRQAEIAARAVRTNELLRATDVDVQGQKHACLGMAVKLQIDAVRSVLTGSPGIARNYFEAVRELSAAAVERGEKWVFSDTSFARCEALKLRTVASWALGIEAAAEASIAALTSWEDLAETEISFDPSERNAHTILGVLAAHTGDFPRAVQSVEAVACTRTSAWCDLLSLVKRLSSPSQVERDRWNHFFTTSVLTPAADKLVADEFNISEACMIANVRSQVNGWTLKPFAVIELLAQ
jgi:hypothetical protein